MNVPFMSSSTPAKRDRIMPEERVELSRGCGVGIFESLIHSGLQNNLEHTKHENKPLGGAAASAPCAVYPIVSFGSGTLWTQDEHAWPMFPPCRLLNTTRAIRASYIAPWRFTWTTVAARPQTIGLCVDGHYAVRRVPVNGSKCYI